MAPIIPQTGRAVLSVSVPLSQKMSCRLQCNMLQAPGNLLALHLQARTKCPWTDLTQNSTSNLILLKISYNSVCCKKCKDTWQCSYQIWLQDSTGVLFENLLRVLVHKEHWPSFFHSSLTSGNLILRQVSYPGITLFFIPFHFSSFNIQIKLTWNMIDLKCIAHANFFFRCFSVTCLPGAEQ